MVYHPDHNYLSRGHRDKLLSQINDDDGGSLPLRHKGTKNDGIRLATPARTGLTPFTDNPENFGGDGAAPPREIVIERESVESAKSVDENVSAASATSL